MPGKSSGSPPQGYSPLQHALGGTFNTPEYEALPTKHAEFVDKTHGNNIKRIQDSEVNFLRWTCQSESNPELQTLSTERRRSSCQRRMCTLDARTRERQKGLFLQVHCSCLLHRNQERQRERRIHRPASSDARCAKTRSMCGSVEQGRRTRADPTQLKLAHGREEASQELHASHLMPWTTRGELQKLQKGQCRDISTGHNGRRRSSVDKHTTGHTGRHL